MRKILTVFALIFLVRTIALAQCNQSLVDNCCSKVGGNATVLHQYKAKLGSSTDSKTLPVARFSAMLTKGNTYRFKICSALDFEGDGVIQLYDGNLMVANSYDEKSKTNFRAFEFTCNKSAIYNIYISFLDGKPGCAVGVLSLVKKQ